MIMAGYDAGNRNSGGYPRDNRSQQSNSGGGRGYGRQGSFSAAVSKPHVPLDPDTYVDTAEGVIKELADRGRLLSTSKIRNLLSMISSLYDEVRRERADKLSKEDQGRIQYIRLHFAYEAGRESSRGRNSEVKDFVEEADIFAHIKDIGDDKERFLLFCRYMEALVAFHRYYGGKE